MRNIKIILKTEINQEYIKQALELDRMSYTDIYQLSVNTCISYYNKNNYIYIMAVDVTTNSVVGYINFSPVTHTMFNRIKSGEVIDTVISVDDIVPYKDGYNCYGYLSSIVVHPDYRQKGLAREMLRHLENLLYELAVSHKIFFNGIVADAVSEIGHYILMTLGFKDIKDSKHDSHIMVLDLFDRQTQKNRYNERLLVLYERS